MGLLDRLKNVLAGDEQEESPVPHTPYRPYVSRAIRENEQNVVARFGLPEYMDRDDWDWVMRSISLWLAPPTDDVLISTFEELFTMCDASIAAALQRGGEVWFDPQKIKAHEMLNLAFQWSKGDSLAALQCILLIVLSTLILWTDMPGRDAYVRQATKLWDFTQNGSLKNGYGQWYDYGPMKAIKLEILRPIKVVDKGALGDPEEVAPQQVGKTVRDQGGTASAQGDRDYWT